MKKRLFIYGTLMALISLIEEIAVRNADGFSIWHFTYIYKPVSKAFTMVTGWFPFSLVELLLYVFLFYLTIGLMISIKKRNIGRYVAITWFLLGLFLLLYVNNCGLNYYLPGYAKDTGLEVTTYDVEELKETCIWLAEGIEANSDQVERDENQVMLTKKDWKEEAVSAMTKLGNKVEALSGSYPLPKALLIPEILSYQQLTGVYSPFTVEANYNGDMPAYNQPFTMCHELSHLKGFMQEKEANFIAFLACIQDENPDFCYSGYLNAFVYCSNVLYRNDYDAWMEVRELLDEAVIADMHNNNEFWDSYDGKAAEIQEKVNDTYLKANGQAEGVTSYDYMVDLVVAYYKQQKK